MRLPCRIPEIFPDLTNRALLQEFSLPAIPDVKWYDLRRARTTLIEVRCHMASAIDPVIAMADSEAGINLVRWSISEVFLSYN